MKKECCVDIGSFNRRVTIEKPDPSASPSDGGHVDLSLDANWTTVGTRWARLRTKGGAEGRALEQVQAMTTMFVEIRSDTTTRAILPNWRLTMDSRIFNVEAAYDVDDAKQVVRCEVKEPK